MKWKMKPVTELSTRGAAVLELTLVFPLLLLLATTALGLIHTVRTNQEVSMLTRELINAGFRECLTEIRAVEMGTCAPAEMISDPEQPSLDPDLPANAQCRQAAFATCVTIALSEVTKLADKLAIETEVRLIVAMPVAKPVVGNPDRTELVPIYAANTASGSEPLCAVQSNGSTRCSYRAETHDELLEFNSTEIVLIGEVARTESPTFFRPYFEDEAYEAAIL